MHRSSGGLAMSTDIDKGVFNSRFSSLPHRFGSDAGSFLAVFQGMVGNKRRNLYSKSSNSEPEYTRYNELTLCCASEGRYVVRHEQFGRWERKVSITNYFARAYFRSCRRALKP